MKGESSVFSYRNLSLIISLLIIILLLFLLGGPTTDAYPYEADRDKVERPPGPVPRLDPVIHGGAAIPKNKCMKKGVI